MKKMFSIAVILLLVICASAARAAPYIVCDPQAGITDYKITGPAWVPATVPAQADGSIKMDVAASTTGINAITVAACKGVWCSDFVPFSFTRPTVPASIGNIRLSP